MNHRFAWTLAAFIPLAVGCLDNVALADRTDAGTRDTPTADVPTADTPVSEVPPVDAPVVDVPPVDAPVIDVPSSPYCPVDLDQNTAQNPNLRFPRAVVLPPPDTGATFPDAPELVVRGRWLAPRRLATPVAVDCVASVAADPACHPDAVIRVQPDGDAGSPVEFVTSVALDALPALADGTAVVLRLDPTVEFAGALSPINVVLSLRRVSDDALLLVVANALRGPETVSAPWEYGAIRLQRGANPDCISRPEPFCQRTFGAYAMEVSGVTAGRALAPREAATFASVDGRFTVRNLLAMHRLPRNAAECADLMMDVFSFEIVRQP